MGNTKFFKSDVATEPTTLVADWPDETIVTESSSKHQHHTAVTGSCTLCDCREFMASTGGRTCINLNSVGGTCNHYEEEHNPE